MLGRVGGAKEDETWTKTVSMRMFLLLLLEDGGGRRPPRRSGARKVNDVAFANGVPIYTSRRTTRSKKYLMVIIPSSHCATATQPLSHTTMSLIHALIARGTTVLAEHATGTAELKPGAFFPLPFHPPFRSCPFSRPDNDPVKDTSK